MFYGVPDMANVYSVCHQMSIHCYNNGFVFFLVYPRHGFDEIFSSVPITELIRKKLGLDVNVAREKCVYAETHE